MMGFPPKRGEDNLTRPTSLCKNFQPNMFNKTKCQNCFRTREAHDLDGDGGNNKPKKVLLCGYLFIAPGLDPENPMPRSRKWQRRCFILYENGELAFALDDSINTVPQGVINMYQCERVFNADAQTGQKFSLAIQTTKATTFIRAETREEKDSWLETLGEYPEINQENERMKQRQLKLAAQHAARQEKYGKPPALGSNSKSSPLPSSKSDTSLNNTLNDSWPKSSSDARDILKDQNDQRKDVYQRSQSTLEARPRYSDPTNSFSKSTSAMMGLATAVDQQDSPTQSSKRKNETTPTLASKSKRADEEMSSARQSRLQNEATSVPASQSSRASRMRARVRASDTGISELSKSGAALALGIQRSRSDVFVDRGAYTPLHQNNNNVNFDLTGFSSRSDPQRRSWRNRSTPEEPLPSTKEVPSPQEKSPRETFPPTKVQAPTTVTEESGETSRDRSSTNESHTSTVSTGSQSSDDLERLDNPRKANFLVNKAMLDGESPSPSKRTIERRKHAHNRRARHTMDGSMHVTIQPSSDESETNKEPPATLKRSNSDPNLADSDDMLKRKQIAMTFPGLFHLKKGWLIKQGDGEQDWSKHWFVLCNNKLSYYKDSSDEDPNSLDGVIDLAKCNKASETPVSRNYGFQIELDTGVIILAAMTCGIRNNWVGAINKAIKTALEDSGKKTPSEESSSLKENQPETKEKARSKPNSLSLSKSTSEVQPKQDRSSPLQPIKKLINNVDLTSTSRTLTQTDSKVPRSPVETKALPERGSSTQPTKTSPIESLPPHSGRPEGRKSSTSKVSSTSESRPRRGSVTKETTSEGRRNSVSKEPETRRKHSASSPRDSSGSESSKSGKTKERRSRRSSRTERRSQEETAAAVTAALSKRTSNMNSEHKQASSPTEENVKSPMSSDQLTHRTPASNSERRSQSSTGDATVIALLEQEVDTLKAQLEQKQTDCSRFQQETVNLKAQLNTEQREHKESFLDLENEQSGYMTQIEQMAERSHKSELTNQKLQAELRQTKNDSLQAQQQVQQLEGQLTNMKNDLKGRDKELDIMKVRLDEVIQDLATSENEIGEIRANLKTERERSESLEIELTDTWMKLRTDGIKGLNVDIVERLSAKLDESRIRLEERENDYVTNEERFEKRLGRIQSQFQSENSALQEKLSAALQESERLRLVDQSELVGKKEAISQKAGMTDQTSSSGMDSRIEELEISLKDVKAQLKAETTAKSVLQKNYNELVAQSAHQFLEGQGDMASTGSDDNTIKLEVDLEVAEKKIERLKKYGEAEREQKTFLEKAFQREQALRKQLEEKLSNSTQESGSSEMEQRDAEIVTVRAELKKAKKEREAVNLVRKQLVSAMDSLKAQLSEKERVVKKISAELETRSSQNTKLEEQVQASLFETANLRSQVESMEAESKPTGRSGPEDQSQLDSLRAEHRQLKRQMGSLQEEHALEMHNRQSELETAKSEVTSLQEKLSELQTKWKNAVEGAAKAENDAAASILEIQKENEQLRSKCERFEKEIKRLRAELHESQDNFDELELQFIHKREDLKRLEQTHEEQIGQMGYRIQDLTSKLASTERKVRDLRGVDHRNRGKGGVGAGGMGMQLTQTRQMETKLKELESKLGDVESTLQNQDQDTSSLLGKIVSVEQQVHNWGQGPSTSSFSSFDAEPHQTQPIQLLSCGSSAASAPRDSISTSGADLSEDSEAGASGSSPDRAKQTFRARFLETKLSETELKLKEVTRKLVDVTTRELENRKAYQGKTISESRLKERLKIMECEIAEVTRELQQVQSNSRTFACAVRASLTDCGQLMGDINSGLGWVDLEIDLDGAGRDGLPYQQQRVEVATNPTTTSHSNMLSCLKTLLTDACHKVDQCKQTALSHQTQIEKQSRDSLLIRERSVEGCSAGSSFTSTGGSSFESTELSLRFPCRRNPSTIDTLQRFANRLSSEVILLGESTYVLHQTDKQKLAKVQMCLGEIDSITAAIADLEVAFSEKQDGSEGSSLSHTSQIISDLLSPRYLLEAESCYNHASPESPKQMSKSDFTKPHIDRHSKSRSPLKRQTRVKTSEKSTHSKSVDQAPVWSPKLDFFSDSLANSITKAAQVEYLSKVKRGNVTSTPPGNEIFSQLYSSELKLEEASISLWRKQKVFNEMFEEHLKSVTVKLSDILALENNRRVKADKEKNRKAGLCMDNDDVLERLNKFVSSAAREMDIVDILDSVGPDLVSYAKQIAMQEARGISLNLVEDEMLLVEVFHLLQVRVADFLKKLSIESDSCQVVLKALSSVGEKRYTHIETFLEDELIRVKYELQQSFQRAMADVKKGTGLQCVDGVDLHAMLGDYVGLLGSLIIRKVVVGGLVRHVIEQIPQSVNWEGITVNSFDTSLDLTTGSSEQTEPVVSRIPEPVSVDYEDMANELANTAMERAESAHLSGLLQNEWEQIMQKGRYSPLEHVTAEHACNMAEVRRRYEDQIKAEELRHEQELNSLQEKYKEALCEVGKLESKLDAITGRRASKPEITLTLEEDLNDIVDDMVARRLSEILRELDGSREKLSEAQQALAAAESEHIKEVDSITDVMENMERRYKKEILRLKTAHAEVVSGLQDDFQDHLKELNKKHIHEKAILKYQLTDNTPKEPVVAASPDKMGQTRNNGDLVLQEKSHREVMEEMRQAHNQEMKALEEEKERDLAEERKATALTVALIKKTHEEELQKEREMLQLIVPKDRGTKDISKKDKSSKSSKSSRRVPGISAIHKSHKQELETQKQHIQQNVSNDVEVVMKRHREVITKMDRDWKIISDKFTKVCSENMSLKKQVESMEKTLAGTRQELETWQGQMKQLIGRKADDMAALRERVLAGYDGEDWGVDGNDNERNPLQVLLRFREAELQCTTNDMNELKVALEVGTKEKKKISEQNVLLEGQHQSQDEYIKQLLTDMEELQQQFERVRTSGEGEAAQDEVVEKSRDHSSAVGSSDTKGDAKLRSWIPFLKRERSDSSGKSSSSSRRRSGSDGTQTTVKMKKGVTE